MSNEKIPQGENCHPDCSCNTPSTDTMEARFKKIFVREDGLLGIGKYDEEVVLDFINAEISYFLRKREEELVGKVEVLFKKEGFGSFQEMGGWQKALTQVLKIIQQP